MSLLSGSSHRRHIVALSLLCVFVLNSTGCIGGLILAVHESSHSNQIRESDTSDELANRFGEPISTQVFDPPRLLLDVEEFRYYRSALEQPTDVDASESMPKSQRLVSVLRKYEYTGHRSASYGDQAVGMFMGIELAWSLMTLGLAELYYVPMAISMVSADRNQTQQLVVAFDEQDRAVASRMLFSGTLGKDSDKEQH